MFNNGLLIGARLRNEIDRHAFAAMLGISYNYLLKIERGDREPSSKTLKKIADATGVPAGDFLRDDNDSFLPENASVPGQIKKSTVSSDDFQREMYLRKNAEERLSEVEKHWNHALAVNVLQERYITILCLDISHIEKSKRKAALARATAREGEVRFDEIQGALRVERRTLKHWLETERTAYACKLFNDKSVIASTPDEAGVLLTCFDCTPHEKGNCSGYGENSNPENIVMLVVMFEANGINNREEQVQILNESYDMNLTGHQLSDILSKIKHGKRVSDNIFYLKGGSLK